MSRKNKNGKRRNYTPKTYGRDFLTPTPIERAIQEVNKPASPQAVAVSDRIACDDKCSYEYKRMPAAWLETDFSYQRKIDAARVERIVNSFDPRLANEVKAVSYTHLDVYKRQVSRRVADDLGLLRFDPTTFEPARLMYWPSTPEDGEFFFHCEDAPFLDPDEVLKTYADWRDASLWPTTQPVERCV